MKATVEYLTKDLIGIRIPKGFVVITMSQWQAGFKRGKWWLRKVQAEKREITRRG